MDLGENLNDTLKGIIADVRLTQPTYWYAIITAYIALGGKRPYWPPNHRA